MNMVAKKSICAVQEEYRGSIEDLPDSPVSYSDEHVASRDEGPETVFWSNAAFRTSLSNSNCSNQEEEYSRKNSFRRDLPYRDSRNASHNKNPIQCFSEKSISVNICRGNLTDISSKRCYKMIKIEAQLKSPLMEKSTPPHKSTSPAESNRNHKTLSGLNNGMIISEDEMKIKAELEKEIEKALEEEIKDDILVLTQRLARLHARQKIRKEECEDHTSEFKTALKSYNGALQDSKCGSILYPKLPQGSTSPLGLGFSSCREIKSHGLDNEGRSLKSHRDPKDPEKKFEKDFDWVRSLRSGAKLNPPKKPNYSFADHERLRNVPPKFSRALHRKSYAKLSPKDERSRKGNDAAEEAKPVCQAEAKPKENRLLLIDMMNRFRASDAYSVGDQSKKGASSRNQASPLKGLVRNAMRKVRLEEDNLMVV